MTEHEDMAFDPDLDKGMEDDDVADHCGPPVMHDCVDDCLESIIELLVKNGYDDSVADEAVSQAMATLMESNEILDTPDLDQPETSKHQWIANASPQIRNKLRAMGLEFEEE